MSLPDIRDNGDCEDEVVLRYVLSRFLPGSFGGDPFDMSGMDCFVAVIRHICSLVDRSLFDHVSSNETLKFVTADYSADTDEKRDNVQKYRVATFIKFEKLVGKENPTFEDIVECEHVRKNFWAHSCLYLFLPVLRRNSGEEAWRSKNDDMFEATESLIEWSLLDYESIEDVLTKTKFGTTRLSSGGEVKFSFGKPSIVRVFLKSKVNRETWQGKNFSIKDAQCFTYDEVTRKTVWRKDKNTTTVSESSSGKPEGTVMYCLVAVVRLQNLGEGRDYVRLYDIESQNVLPHGDQNHLGTYNNDCWSLGHLDHDHMLYYVRAGDRSIDCVRRMMEFGDQDPDPECVRGDERLLDGLWQTTSALGEASEPSAPVEDDDIYLGPHRYPART